MSRISARWRVTVAITAAVGVVLLFVDSLEDSLATSAPLALLVAAVLGYLIAGRALAPVVDAMIRERAFISDASHELRTPLAVLKAELELAGDPGRSEAELRAAIASAADEVDRLTRLADDLLILARSDQGVLQVRRERADIGEICSRVAGRFSRRAEELQRDLTVDRVVPGLVQIDVLRVEQAIGNLIDNSLRHGSGAVRVSSRLEGDDELLIEVSDEGPGIPSDFAPRAFERFTRADAGRTEGGTGLGLAIVEAIAEAHGGSVAIDGVTVRMRLPVG